MKKIFLKEWAIKEYYKYKIYQVQTGTLSWLIAEPDTPGTATRCANTEQELRIILENDCINIINRHKLYQKSR